MKNIEQTPEESKLAKIIVDALDLEDIGPEEISPEAALFGFDELNSLGLDSIDALEISLVVAQEFGIHLKADDENNKSIFATLRSLTNHINSTLSKTMRSN